MPLGKAMITAGYAEKSAEAPGQNFLDRRGTEVAMDEYREKLRGRGIDEDKIITKIAEMIDAKMVKTSLTEPDRMVPDYKTQIEALKLIRDDFGMSRKEDKGDISLTQNNYYGKLTDEQLDAVIESKLRQVGISNATSGEGKTN
jgi:hypothetical protein